MRRDASFTKKEVRALFLFGQIAAELNPEDFTVEELNHEFRSWSASGAGFGMDVNPTSELKTLISLGFVEETGEEEHYRITEKGREFHEQQE